MKELSLSHHWQLLVSKSKGKAIAHTKPIMEPWALLITYTESSAYGWPNAICILECHTAGYILNI